MILGFTGTREGMTPKQMHAVAKLVNELQPDWAVHGDCRGSDEGFHQICINARGGILSSRPPKIRIRPCDIDSQRAFCNHYDEIMPQKPPLERNTDIVNDCDKLIATPFQYTETFRSGTWSTIRKAKRAGKIVYIVRPDGEIV